MGAKATGSDLGKKRKRKRRVVLRHVLRRDVTPEKARQAVNRAFAAALAPGARRGGAK